MRETGFKLGRSRGRACAESHCALCPGDSPARVFSPRQTSSPQQAARSHRSGPTPCTSPDTSMAGAQQLSVHCRLGPRRERRGSRAPSKRRAHSPSPTSSPSTAPLPGGGPTPGRHLLWVISICMAIITAFGKKIPLSKSPAELLMPAQNWRRQLRQAPSASNKAGAAVPTLLLLPRQVQPQKSTAAPAGSLGSLAAWATPASPLPTPALERVVEEGAAQSQSPCAPGFPGRQSAGGGAGEQGHAGIQP